MIERFNFYDVYGYLIPGLALIGFAWLPFAWVSHSWPQNELLSAVMVLAFGYLLGMLLQNVATSAVPSQFRYGGSDRRSPSDVLLESENALASETQLKIAAKVKDNFGIDFSTIPDKKKLSKARNDAFLMARVILIQEKVATYAEQFQGLYAMMRGLSIAFALGFIYLVSWFAAIFRVGCLRWLAFIFCGISLITVVICGALKIWRPQPHDKASEYLDLITLVSVAVGVLAEGYLLGFSQTILPHDSKILALLAVMSFIAAERFYLAYRYFAFEFARTVWRDFAAKQTSTGTK